MKHGLMMLSQEAMGLGEIGYHDFCGTSVDNEERPLIAKSLGPINSTMFLRNHGIVVCADSVEQAWFLIYNAVDACEMQVKLLIYSDVLLHT